MKMTDMIMEWAGAVNRLERPFSDIKEIGFPKNEIPSLRKRSRIVTHRVSDDFDKFSIGDCVETPWGVRYRVTGREDITDIRNSRYLNSLSDKQKDFLGNFDRIAVLILDLNLEFREIDRSESEEILEEIPDYSDNERLDTNDFKKFMSSEKKIDNPDRSGFFGMFDCSGRCLSLCFLNYGVPEGFVLIAEVQAVIHGYGMPLIKRISDMFGNMWLAANPSGGEKLLCYYRQFGFKEMTVGYSKWVDGPEHFFYKASNGKSEEFLIDYIQSSTQG